MAEWRDPGTRVVGSLTHGVVADTAWSAAIDAAFGRFVQDKDVAKFATAVRGVPAHPMTTAAVRRL